MTPDGQTDATVWIPERDGQTDRQTDRQICYINTRDKNLYYIKVSKSRSTFYVISYVGFR